MHAGGPVEGMHAAAVEALRQIDRHHQSGDSAACVAALHALASEADQRPRLLQELGAGYTLLALGLAEEALEPWRRAAQNLGLPLKLVADEGQGEAGRYQARLVLVRPDQFVAWAADEAVADEQRAEDVLRRVRG